MTEANVYDVFDYPGYSFPDTHPDRLSVMARLHGLSPAPVETCRVLEIGCGEGANLIPMAHALPRGEFTGFDLAHRPIERGQRRASALALTNLRLLQADLMEVGEEPERGSLGEYDYIIAHGLYSWTPQAVRDRLLAVCASHLAPEGVAFVSYNAYPGSYMRDLIRAVLGWTQKGHPAGEEPIAAGLDLLQALMQTRSEDDPYRRIFEEQLSRMRRRADNTTIHDELSPAYHPVWVSEFVGHARQHGLEFLSEAELPVPSDPCFRPEIMARVKATAGEDAAAQDEMLDVARMRMYRQTLLVRAGQTIQRELQPAALQRMRLASSAVSAAGEHPGQRFYGLQGGMRVASDQPPALAVMERLIAAWPRTISFEEACRALAEGGLPAGADPARLLLQMAIARMIELHAWEPGAANTVSERPRVAELCRQEAALRPYAANLWHGTVQLDDPVVRKLLLLADGSRSRTDLLQSLQEGFPEIAPSELESGLEENLERFRRAALLSA